MTPMPAPPYCVGQAGAIQPFPARVDSHLRFDGVLSALVSAAAVSTRIGSRSGS